MKYTITFLAIAGAAIAQSSSSASPSNSDQTVDYLTSVCAPSNSTGYPDFNAPCNAVYAIQAECIYGPAYLQAALSEINSNLRRRSPLSKRQSDDSNSDEDDTPMQSNSTQRICFCESQFFDQFQGCADCYSAHGSGELSDVDANVISSLSSSYCAASSTPTAGFADILYSLAPVDATSTPTATSSFHDPLGNRTQVSLYFTPKVTGTAAWLVAEETSGTAGTFTAVNTQDGQIRPTATTDNAAATTSNAAVKTEAVAFAGVIGVAGLVALL